MLLISHHKLQGEVVKLKKPFAVLEKRHNQATTETEYAVVAVLRKKYVFAARPQPLVDEESKGKASCKSCSKETSTATPNTRNSPLVLLLMQ